MKFWNWKFILALVIVVAMVVDATWKGPDPTTGEPRHLLPYTGGTPASFVFLLSVLYVLSHAGGWVLAKFRSLGQRKRPSGRRSKQRK
ncbi:MAG: hypothetical protein ACLF0G_16070 [Candidatus Brocadiia bacterium]